MFRRSKSRLATSLLVLASVFVVGHSGFDLPFLPSPSEAEFRVFITEEPVGKFCPSKAAFDPVSNKSVAICLGDPENVHLIVNWEFVSQEEAHYPGSNWDWVGLYDGFPESHSGEKSAVEWTWTYGKRSGSTKISSATLFGQLRVNLTSAAILQAKTRPGNCLPFYAVYNRWTPSKQDYEIESISCHRIYPNWMERAWTSLESFSLKELLIPGTHDTGTASMLDPLVSPFTRTQSQGIYRQLLYGARYFDVRVGHNPDLPDKFRIVHNIFWANTSISALLEDVKQFLQEFESEFVILDFHKFQMGMLSRSAFRDLLTLIEDKLGHLWIPFEERHQTLGPLRQLNKRVVISFNCRFPSLCAPHSFHPRPWNKIPQEWPNTRSLLRVKHVLRRELSFYRDNLWVAQPIFTPVKIMRNIRNLLEDYEWLNANIVAVDFYQTNQMTQLAIDINFLRWKLLLNMPS